MNTVRVIISLVSLVIVLIIVQSVAIRVTQNKSDTLKASDSRETRQEVQSTQITPSPTPSLAGPTAAPSQAKSKLSPIPSTDQQTTVVIVTAFIYPNATITEQSDTHAKLQTVDSVNSVFQWYEKKIDEFAGRSKSIVKTEVNNDFLAKLRAMIKNGLVNIEIRKNTGEKTVFIELSISPS